MAKGKRPPPPSTDTHRSKVAPTRPTGQPTRLTLYCPAKQGQHRQTEKCQHMPARQLCKQPFRDKLHLGQLARYGTVCCRTYSVPHFALWPIFIMGSADPRLGAFYEALGPFSGVFPPFYLPNVRRLPVFGFQVIGSSASKRTTWHLLMLLRAPTRSALPFLHPHWRSLQCSAPPGSGGKPPPTRSPARPPPGTTPGGPASR